MSSGFMVEEDVLPAEGETALGVRSGLHWSLVLDNAENKKFTADYKAKTGKDANVFAMQGYDTGRVIVEMLNKLQGDTSSVDKMIQTLPGITFASPRGTFALDEKSQAPKQHIYLREVKKGSDGIAHNFILQDLGEIVDPGDDSKG
jgi:branched-chain amino acid transport system substrate-binding protein